MEKSTSELIEEIIDNPDKIFDESLTDDQILEIQKKLNPYSFIHQKDAEGVKRVAAASFTNLREDYVRKFTMTSLIGFLYKVYDEWDVPDKILKFTPKNKKVKELHKKDTQQYTADELVGLAHSITKVAEETKKIETEYKNIKHSNTISDEKKNEFRARIQGLKYVTTKKLYTYGESANYRLDDTIKKTKSFAELDKLVKDDPIESYRVRPNEMTISKKMAKNILKKFLDMWFVYDPNKHAAPASDKETRSNDIKRDSNNKFIDTIDPERLTFEEFSKQTHIKNATHKILMKTLTDNELNYNAAVRVMCDDNLCKIIKQIITDDDTLKAFQKYTTPIRKDSDVIKTIQNIPPNDTYHRWKYYTTVNYEEIRKATEVLYCEKPDLDWALILYDYNEGSETDVEKWFDNFKFSHQDELVCSVSEIEFGRWTLLGDFKNNRNKTTFYNKNTGVLERIMKSRESDEKFGRELMQNRILQGKAQNIKNDGPDDARLSEYQTVAPTLSAYGAKKAVSPEEMKRLNKAGGNIKIAKELEIIEKYEKIVFDLEEAAKSRPLLEEEKLYLAETKKQHAKALEMISVPSDAIQVDVFKHDTIKKTMTKSKFYTKANIKPEESEGDNGN